MKLPLIATLAVFSLGGLASQVFAVDPVPQWGTTSTFTVALTLSYTTEGTVLKDETGKTLTGASAGPAFENHYAVITKNSSGMEIKRVETDEYVSKVTTYKYGNAELLKDMVANDVIPKIGSAPFIAGWSIVLVSVPVGDSGDTIDKVYARHTNKTMKLIDLVWFELDDRDSPAGEANTENYKYVTTTVTNPSTMAATETFTLADSFSSVGTGYGHVATDFDDLKFVGVITETGTKTVVKVDTIGGDKVYTSVPVMGALKLDKIIGKTAVTPIGAVDTPGVIGGTLSLAAATVLDLNGYNLPPASP